MLSGTICLMVGGITISRSRKFRLCLILIVDGVLLTSTSPGCPMVKHVKRLDNLSKFLEFPWGRVLLLDN